MTTGPQGRIYDEFAKLMNDAAGLAQSALRKLVAGALRHNGVRDELPEALRRNLNLPSLPEALHPYLGGKTRITAEGVLA